MIIKTEDDIKKLVESDAWMMDVLRAAEKLDLPDWWIGGGFLRNKVWNVIGGISAHSGSDVDLSYFNQADVSPETDWAYDERMNLNFPFADWQVRNQARMHYVNGLAPFSSTKNSISHWPETATCVAVKLQNGELTFIFYYGIEDLVNLVLRPIPEFKTGKLLDVFNHRVQNKNWMKTWPDLKVELD